MPVLDLRHSLDGLSDTFDLSNDDLARAVGASAITVKRWRASSTIPQGEARKRLDALWELKNRLDASFTSASASRAWLSARNRYLGNFTPREALLLGHLERVNAALEALDSGIFL